MFFLHFLFCKLCLIDFIYILFLGWICIICITFFCSILVFNTIYDFTVITIIRYYNTRYSFLSYCRQNAFSSWFHKGNHNLSLRINKKKNRILVIWTIAYHLLKKKHYYYVYSIICKTKKKIIIFLSSIFFYTLYI